jgi:hypothetical protein
MLKHNFWFTQNYLVFLNKSTKKYFNIKSKVKIDLKSKDR